MPKNITLEFENISEVYDLLHAVYKMRTQRKVDKSYYFSETLDKSLDRIDYELRKLIVYDTLD